jgi:hypothetical protein
MTVLSCGSPDTESTQLLKEDKEDKFISEWLKWILRRINRIIRNKSKLRLLPTSETVSILRLI